MLLTVDGIAVDDDNHDADAASMTIIRGTFVPALTLRYSNTDTYSPTQSKYTGIVYHKYLARCKYYEYTGFAIHVPY